MQSRQTLDRRLISAELDDEERTGTGEEEGNKEEEEEKKEKAENEEKYEWW